MRQLILGAALLALTGPAAAHGDTLATLDASQVATQDLDACFDRNFVPGEQKSGDGGASKRRLLDACAAEWDVASQACHANTGNPVADCRKQTGSLADAYLALKGTGVK